jgi:hypothetical protein
MDTEMTDAEYEGLTKLLNIAGADVSYSMLGQPDEAIFTIPQLIKFIDIISLVVTNNIEQFAQTKEDDVQ